MAERVGFEPTVPLPRRMLSKHVDSSTLAPLRDRTIKGSHLITQVGKRQGKLHAEEGNRSWLHVGNRFSATEALATVLDDRAARPQTLTHLSGISILQTI